MKSALRRYGLRAILVLACLAVLVIPSGALASPSSAPPPGLPETFWGIALKGTQNWTGASVTVTVGGEAVNYVTPATVDAQGYYSIVVPQDPDGVVGAVPGATIRFLVNGLQARLYDVVAQTWVSQVTYSPMVGNLNLNLYNPGITVGAGPGGTITPDPADHVQPVAYGADQKFDIAAGTGFKIKDVGIDGKSMGPLTTYTFPAVTADHVITATFEATGHLSCLPLVFQHK